MGTAAAGRDRGTARPPEASEMPCTKSGWVRESVSSSVFPLAALLPRLQQRPVGCSLYPWCDAEAYTSALHEVRMGAGNDIIFRFPLAARLPRLQQRPGGRVHFLIPGATLSERGEYVRVPP